MWGISRLFGAGRRQSITNSGKLGRLGEELARRYIAENGYRVVVAGFIAPIGRSRGGRPIYAEVDLIAWDDSTSPATLAFIEVKTRSSGKLASPEAAVDRRKQRRVARAARFFRRMLRVEDERFRFDVVSIIVEPESKPVITLIRDYFRD